MPLNKITNKLLPGFTWNFEDETHGVLEFHLALPLNRCTKAHMKLMVQDEADAKAALESIEFSGNDAGQRYNQPFATLGDGLAWTTSSKGNLATTKDIQEITNLINQKSEGELKASPVIKALHAAHIKGKKKHYEEQVFPKLTKLFSQFSNECKINYVEESFTFRIEVQGINQQKAVWFSIDTISALLAPNSELLASLYRISLHIDPDFTTATIYFSSAYYDTAVNAGTLGPINLKVLVNGFNRAYIDDRYQKPYNHAVQKINYQISQQYSVSFPLSLENLQYFNYLNSINPKLMYGTIMRQLQNECSGIEAMLLLQQLPTPQIQAGQLFFPITENRTEILSRLQALGIPQLIFTERNNGIHVFSMAAKHVLNQYLSASNSNNNNNVAVSSEPILISSHYAMKLSQTIVTQLELAGKPTSPAKFLFAYLMRNIKTTQTDKTLEKGDEGKLIEDICRRLKNVIVKSDAELFEVLTREQSQDQSSVSNNNATTNFSCK